ncbi:MAG: hypothetical protein EBU01_12670, partial [Crocinitomicaceae bacterium]|nr:hypothetical protein [Crocinitomicaceae bacterium]
EFKRPSYAGSWVYFGSAHQFATTIDETHFEFELYVFYRKEKISKEDWKKEELINIIIDL